METNFYLASHAPINYLLKNRFPNIQYLALQREENPT